MHNQAKGSVTEQIFEQAATYYRNNRELTFCKTYPPFTVTETDADGKTIGFFQKEGPPDYILSLIVQDDLGRTYGQSVWIEVKGFSVKALTHTRKHRQRLHQYDMMRQAHDDGKAEGFYLTEWAVKGADPIWALYDVTALNRETDHIAFKLAKGHIVPSLLGWPEFKPIMIEILSKKG